MSLRDEIVSRYTDEDGLILERPNSSPGPDTGNGIHNLSVYATILHITGELNADDVFSFSKVIDSCRVNQSENGLYNRGPRKPGDLIGHDDYICLSAAASLINVRFARDIALYGGSHGWSFNNENPGKWTFKSWQGRRLWLIPYWKINGGISACRFSRAILELYIESQKHQEDAGERILQWMICRSMEGRINDLSRAIQVWKRGLFEVFPSGMRSVFSAYYNPAHPFAKYSSVY